MVCELNDDDRCCCCKLTVQFLTHPVMPLTLRTQIL